MATLENSIVVVLCCWRFIAKKSSMPDFYFVTANLGIMGTLFCKTSATDKAWKPARNCGRSWLGSQITECQTNQLPQNLLCPPCSPRTNLGNLGFFMNSWVDLSLFEFVVPFSVARKYNRQFAKNIFKWFKFNILKHFEKCVKNSDESTFKEVKRI